MKHKSAYYIYKVKCLIEVYINFTNEFDRGHGHLNGLEIIRHEFQHLLKHLVCL